MPKFKYILCLLVVSLQVNADSGLFGKDISEITCKDIIKLSTKELKMVAMGIMLGTTAEGVAVSIFSRVGLEKRRSSVCKRCCIFSV